MAEYVVTISVSYSINARNEAQAEERGERIANALAIVNFPKTATRLGDMAESPTVEVEES